MKIAVGIGTTGMPLSRRTPGHHQEAAQGCRVMFIISPGVGARRIGCVRRAGRGLYSILVDIRPPDIILFLYQIIEYIKNRR